MPAKPAQPDRYVVDRIGTPDPDSTEYYVLDIVNDWTAREVLALLGNKYRQRGQDGRAQECFDHLHATQQAHRAVMDLRNPKTKKKTTKRQNQPA